MYYVFHHISGHFTIEKFVLEKLDRNLGLADPPPQLGQNPEFFQKIDLKASLRILRYEHCGQMS